MTKNNPTFTWKILNHQSHLAKCHTRGENLRSLGHRWLRYDFLGNQIWTAVKRIELPGQLKREFFNTQSFNWFVIFTCPALLAVLPRRPLCLCEQSVGSCFERETAPNASKLPEVELSEQNRVSYDHLVWGRSVTEQCKELLAELTTVGTFLWE